MRAKQSKSLVGKKIGRLTVIRAAPRIPDRGRRLGRLAWVCRCRCGNTVVIRQGHLIDRRGRKTESCGCLSREQLEQLHKKQITHGAARDRATGKRWPEYRVWSDIIRHCYNKRHKFYPYYGGKGIRVWKDWLKFTNFIRDVGRRPEGKQILGRIDPRGYYEPRNIRWMSREEWLEIRRAAA